MPILNFQKPDKIILQKASDFQAQFEFRPLEPGYAVTIGNSLRRVLLNSLEGYAITGVKIEGVDHEFSHERVILSIKNRTEFTAGMIGEGTQSFQVMNPDLLICTLDSSSRMDVELTIGKGRGYVPAEDNKPKDAPLGYIPIDAIYTPIKNVKYTIENTRVEQRTDFEKLIMEVSTDGTIHPEEAVKQASRILIQHLMIITDENITFDNKEE